jgi:hypothetical protein
MMVRGLASYLFAVVLLSASPNALAQTTWYVDDDALGDPGPGNPAISDPGENGSAARPFDAIQEAVDQSAAGDIVIVLDGTYTGTGNKDIDPDGRAVTICSENGPQTCVIDCLGSGRGFFFASGETDATIVEGFTIRNGLVMWGGPGGGNGGAIYCEGSSPRIVSCVMSGNWAEQDGGALFCNWLAGPTVVDCVIVDNESTDYGGGVCCYNDGHVTLENCTVDGNTATAGSGIAAFNCSPTLTGCTVVNNSSEGGT